MVDDQMMRRLNERAGGSAVQYTAVRSREVARCCRGHVLIVDPMLSTTAYESCSKLLRAAGGVSLICYTRLHADSVRRLVSLARLGFFSLILWDSDDNSQSLRSVLLREETLSTSRRVLASLEPQLALLNERLRKAVCDLFRAPSHYWGAEDIAVAAGISRPTLYRAFWSVGLSSPKQLVTTARVARLIGGQISGCESFAESRKRSGYVDQRILRTELSAAISRPLCEIGSQTENEVIDRLVDFATSSQRT
jgi:AraC-like DNA-binding protein